ncbi:unnamed protein product [Schistocephalus solidus]|uniref:SH2 domain-containing protein n=1 Tax=Schistocephalus solidus TaxID=70667 RepID=A0A183TCI5_SCHSO|nr:unnamed protein product [Schistocephalus solidus]
MISATVNGTNAKYLGIDLLVSEFRRANNCIVCSLGKPIVGGKPPPHITVYGTTNELHHAVRKANLKGVRDLLTRVASSNVSLSEYINEKSADSGATPLIEAAKTGSNDIVRLLLDHEAQVNLRDCGGFTALHRACQKSFAHVAETLLRRGRANPQIKCPFSGNTALHEAAMLGHADCVNCLLRFHAAPWARNAESEMPFELALRYGFAELAIALAGYQPAPPLTTQADWFHPALSKGETERMFASCSAMQDGAFLVRRSSQSERKFVLVLYYQRQTLKYQIEVVDFSFHLDTKEAGSGSDDCSVLRTNIAETLRVQRWTFNQQNTRSSLGDYEPGITYGWLMTATDLKVTIPVSLAFFGNVILTLLLATVRGV